MNEGAPYLAGLRRGCRKQITIPVSASLARLEHLRVSSPSGLRSLLIRDGNVLHR